MQAATKLAQLQKPGQEPVEITLLELVCAVADSASNDREVVAVVCDLINSGKITLVGNFQGADVRVG